MPKEAEIRKSGARVVQPADVAGMERLEKRRAAIKRLHDFKDGVL